MKKILIFFASALLLVACQLPTSYHLVQFSGALENPPPEAPELDFFRDYLNNDRSIVALDLNARGAFATTFEVPGPVMATLTIGRSRLPVYLERGYTLHLKGDASSIDSSLEFTGEGSAENNFLTAYRREIESQITGSLLQNAARDLDPSGYKLFADSIAGLKLDFFRNHVAYSLSGKGFRTFFETGVLYEKYQMLLNYPTLHQRLHPSGEKPVLPADYYDFLKQALQHDDQPLSNLVYTNFLLSYLDYKKEGYEGGFDRLSRHEANYLLAGRYLSGPPRYYIQALSVSREMHSGNLGLAMSLYEDYMEHSPVAEYRQSLAGALDVITSLWAGNPAPGFVMTDIEGNTVSLHDFYGKVVYLKFWASWCGPCMRQVPPAAELKKRLADEEDLVFLYVSIDRDEEAWRSAVARHGITGVHMRTPGRERGVPALYNVRWIPTFYLIGRDGNIYDHRPPYPDNPELDAVLRSALHQDP
ncbi:MAG: TlpA disulfide reductase family protein [Bacteroidales bacterium]|nr:TlpA disulfide reductase family protein [Bacteroidales bacterium]